MAVAVVAMVEFKTDRCKAEDTWHSEMEAQIQYSTIFQININVNHCGQQNTSATSHARLVVVITDINHLKKGFFKSLQI